jgi:hypothetical protein
MSIIHVNQIKAHISKLFDKKINVQDLGHANQESIDSQFLTRALSAYALHYLSQVDADTAAAAVTDGGKDNGIDALHYDEREKRLYIIQSKWIHSGTGEPDNGDVKKFVSGIRDLFNLRFDRFNDKVNLKKDSVVRALTDPHTKYAVVLAHTGLSRLAIPSQTDLDDLAAEINDASEVLTITLLNQSDLHTSLTIGLSGDPINLDIGIKSWGRVQEPHVAYYGQLNARQIVEWWSKFRTRLFAKNLRSMLGDTDVNNEIRDTLTTLPSHFWYFNNGVTIVAKKL